MKFAYRSRCGDSYRNPMQVSEANSSTKASLASPFRIGSNYNFATRILVAIINVKFQRLSFVRFDERKKVFAFMKNRVSADDVVAEGSKTRRFGWR